MRAALRSIVEMFVLVVRTDRRKMLVAVGLMVAGGATWPALALALRAGIDAAAAHDVARAAQAGLLVALCTIGVMMLQHFAYIPYAESAELATVTLESELIDLANRSTSLRQHDDHEFAERMTIMQKGVGEFHDGILGLMSLFALVTSALLTGIVLLFVSPWLLLLPAAAVLPVLAGQRAQVILNRAKEQSAGRTRAASGLFELATTAAPAKELRLFRLQAEVRRRHADLWDEIGADLRRAERRAAAITALGQLAFGAAYVGGVLLVLAQTIRGHGTVGDVVLVVVLATQVSQQVNAALDLFRRLQRMAQGMTRLRWLRAAVVERAGDGTAAPPPPALRRGIDLERVSFAYPGTTREVLDDVTVHLPAGSTVALVGENGAGKSTLVDLLCRFYEPTEGRIVVDDVDLAGVAPQDWRRRIAAGFQDFVRYEVLARHCVGLGDLSRIDDAPAVADAIDRAQAQPVLDGLDDGLDSQLGRTWTDGSELSGGQWQKLAIGRAMMRTSPLLLVLDEPASALDAEAEHELFDRYAQNAVRVGRETGAVTVLVSHRFSTVQMADTIVVLSGGRVVDQGDHASLLRRGGLYAELYGLQATAYS